jgi:1-acyl-sn-glycerol-3-phosphate acyltransferase
MHYIYYLGRGLIKILVFSFASWKVKGRQNIPKDKPVLIVCNHIHIADPPMVAASLPIKCKIMGKEELWHNAWSRYWVSNFGAFPVRRVIGADAIRSAESAIKEGFSVMMFPEGGRSQTAQLMQAQPGAALIASRMKVPILPVSITGTENFRHLKSCFFRHPQITITIGQPFDLPPHDGRLPRGSRQEMADYIMNKIAVLLPPQYRGVYGTTTKTDN